MVSTVPPGPAVGTAVFAPGLLRGRLALVTGGGTGIGLATARELGSLGARVVLAARTADRLAQAVDALRAEGIEAWAHPVDIRDEASVAALFDGVVSGIGMPDVLVNNAGGQFAADPLEISANGFRAVVDLNLNGTWHMCSAYGRRLHEAGRGGRIVNIVVVSDQGAPTMAHGAAARAGVENLTRSLARAWGPSGILVNAIAPGTIDTPALAQYDQDEVRQAVARQPVPRWGTPREVALLVAYLASSAGDFVTGSTLYVDGGSHLEG